MITIILPTDQEIKDALWEHADHDLDGDTIQHLFSLAIPENKPQTEEDYDDLYDAISKRFDEVMR